MTCHAGCGGGGQYSSNVCILLYKGQMLAYDPASNLMEWVPMWGMLLSLTSAKLKSTNDLSNIFLCPHPKAAPSRMQSPRPICSWPVGDRTDSDSWKTYSDSEVG